MLRKRVAVIEIGRPSQWIYSTGLLLYIRLGEHSWFIIFFPA